jgi:hypothetical protein
MKMPRNEKITIKSASADTSAEAADEGGEKRPRNLPAVNARSEGFSLVVDGKAKSHYADEAAATSAGLTLKRSFPMLQITVYDAVKKIGTRIELPGASGAATPAAAAKEATKEASA